MARYRIIVLFFWFPFLLSCSKSYDPTSFFAYLESEPEFFKQSESNGVVVSVKYRPSESIALKETNCTKDCSSEYAATYQKFSPSYFYQCIIEGLDPVGVAFLTNKLNRAEYDWMKLNGVPASAIQLESVSPQKRTMRLICSFKKEKVQLEERASLEVFLNSANTFYFSKELLDKKYNIEL